MAETIKIYDDIEKSHKLLNNTIHDDITFTNNSADNQSIDNCTSLQRNYLSLSQQDNQKIDNKLRVGDVRKRLALQTQFLHKFTLRQLSTDDQILPYSNDSDIYFKRVGEIIYDIGVEVNIDDEVVDKETKVSHHVTIKSLLEGSIIER